MPSEIVDRQGLSSPSIFSEELYFPNERQVGFWKTERMPISDHQGLNSDGMLRATGNKSITSAPLTSTLQKRMLADPYSGKCFDITNIHLKQGQQANPCIDTHVMGLERATNNDIHISPLDHGSGILSTLNVKPASYIAEGYNSNVRGHQYENGLFSSSLSELFSRKMTLSSSDDLYGHSVGGAAPHYEEEETFGSLEEMEAQTIGDLLPDDDDLFSGVTDGLDYIAHPNSKDDVEDSDFFGSVGGLDLGEDGYSVGQVNVDLSNRQLGGSNVALAGGQPHGGYASRTLFVRNINSNVEDSEIRALFEQYGDIRTLYTACKHRGFVMISYYDLRAALTAMETLQNKPLRRRKLDIHFSIPKDNLSEKDVDQGSLEVLNISSALSNDELQQILGIYGEIKEIRESPHNSHHKYIEFYDIRAAEAAVSAVNKGHVAGNQIKLEPGLRGDNICLMQPVLELERNELSAYLRRHSSNNLTPGISGTAPHGTMTSYNMGNGTIAGLQSSTGAPTSHYLENPFHHGISSSVPSSLSSRVSVAAMGSQSSVPDLGHSAGQLKFEVLPPTFHPHSLPNYNDNFGNVTSCFSQGNMAANISVRPSERTENWQFSRFGSKGHSVGRNEGVFGPTENGSSGILPAHHYTWNTSPTPQGSIWSNSASFVNGLCSPQPTPGFHSIPRAPSHMMNTVLPINSHHVGSAPSINPSLWDRRHAYAGESPDASAFHPGSLGNMRISSNSVHPLEYVSQSIFPHVGGNCMDMPISSKGLHSPQQMFPRGKMYPMMSPFDTPNERSRSRRNEGSSNQADSKKQYELDIDRIMRQEDKRTTLMIKNIPNKYTSKMLMAAIDERHRGTYDFIYLPIDFKNKCNVGYAFINMTDPSLIIPFYQAFNGKKWEKFNSEKVASLAYARIQGKAALIAHFQNSSLMNEDKRCRPILFHTDGPNAGDQVPFPMGVNVRSRPNKSRAGTTDENHLETPADLVSGEESSSGDSSSGSLRDTD